MKKKIYIVAGVIILAVVSSFFVSKNLLQGSFRATDTYRPTDTDSSGASGIPVTHNDELRLLPYPLKPSDFDFIANKYGRDIFSRPLTQSRKVDDGAPTPTLPPRVYKVAFVSVTWGETNSHGNPTPENELLIDKIRVGLPTIFNQATYGLATLDTSYPLVKIFVKSPSNFDPYKEDFYSNFLPEFYLKNPDDFDFIFFYSSNWSHLSRYHSIRADFSGGFMPNDSGGEEPTCFDRSKKYNIKSTKLKGFITMSRVYKSDFPAVGGSLSYYSYLSKLIGSSFDETTMGQFFEQSIALHEIEHAWSLHITPSPDFFIKHPWIFSPQKKELFKKLFGVDVNPKINNDHFGQLVESQESADPHDAVKFELTPDNKVKICLNEIPPFKPYRFTPTVLYFMGFGYKFNNNIQYTFVNNYYPNSLNPTGQSLVIDSYEKNNGCFIYKINPHPYDQFEVELFKTNSDLQKSHFDSYTLNDIKTLYPDIHQCK